MFIAHGLYTLQGAWGIAYGMDGMRRYLGRWTWVPLLAWVLHAHPCSSSLGSHTAISRDLQARSAVLGGGGHTPLKKKSGYLFWFLPIFLKVFPEGVFLVIPEGVFLFFLRKTSKFLIFQNF